MNLRLTGGAKGCQSSVFPGDVNAERVTRGYHETQAGGPVRRWWPGRRTIVLVPVQANVELFSSDQFTPQRLTDAVIALNGELQQHFSRSAVVVGIPAAGIENLTKVDTSTNDAGEEVVTATLVLALMNIDADGAQELAGQFRSQRFPTAHIGSTSEAQLDRLRGLSAFAGVTSTAHDNAAARINDIRVD